MSRSLITSVGFAALALLAVVFTAEASPGGMDAAQDPAAGLRPGFLVTGLLDEIPAEPEAASLDLPVDAVLVPEPPTYALAMVAGMLGAGAAARRRVSKA